MVVKFSGSQLVLVIGGIRYEAFAARLTEKQKELAEIVQQGYAPNLERIKILRREINELIHHEEVF